MPTPQELLDRWQGAGLLDTETAQRIRDFETRAQRKPDEDRPGVLEAMVYLGVAIAVVGVIVLVGANWDELEDWARVAVVAVPGVLALLAGQALRSFKEPGLVRGGHMAWVVATALLAGSVALFGAVNDWDETNVALATGVTATVVALALWALAPSHPQVLAIGGGLFETGLSLATFPDDDPGFLLGGGALVLFGLAGIVVTELGVFVPRFTARLVFAALLAFGAFFAGLESGAVEPIGFAAAVILVALSVLRGGLPYTLAGVAVGFASLFRAIIVHIDDPTMAALALVVVGVLLVATVITLTRFHPWRQAGEPV